MEVIPVTVHATREVALDVYLRTVSGRSLSEALAAGHRFGDDVAEYAPPDEGVEHLRRTPGVSHVQAGDFMIRVHGRKSDLERVFACRMTALPTSGSPDEDDAGAGLREVTPREFAERLRQAVVEHLGPRRAPEQRPEGWVDERWAPDPSVHVRLETTPHLRGLERWIDAIEPADRWPIRAERPEIVCQIVGHDWDILLFLSPFAVLECIRCGARNSSFPASVTEELLSEEA
jgi:hypothetical protein